MIDVLQRISELMEEKQLSCYELSNLSGISTNAIYDWFKKGATPTMNNIVKICNACDISLEKFFCGNSMYKLTPEEDLILKDWFAMSDLEKSAVKNIVETFKILKNGR